MSNDLAGVPTWDEGVASLLAKLPELLGDGKLTQNDARVIRHLADRPTGTRTARCPVCLPGAPWPGPFVADTDKELFALIANHVMRVHNGGSADAFNAAERALPWVGQWYRKDAAERPELYQP